MKNVIIVMFGLFLISCATGYVKQGFMGGYNERMVNDGVWEVSFAGNGYTGQERAKNFCMRRCAELTIEKGSDYFKVLDQNLEASESTTAYTSYNSYSKTSTTTFDKVSKPVAKVVIQFVEKKEYDEMRKKYPLNYFKAAVALELYPKE